MECTEHMIASALCQVISVFIVPLSTVIDHQSMINELLQDTFIQVLENIWSWRYQCKEKSPRNVTHNFHAVARSAFDKYTSLILANIETGFIQRAHLGDIVIKSKPIDLLSNVFCLESVEKCSKMIYYYFKISCGWIP